jgi:hypothetical protein
MRISASLAPSEFFCFEHCSSVPVTLLHPLLTRLSS